MDKMQALNKRFPIFNTGRLHCGLGLLSSVQSVLEEGIDLTELFLWRRVGDVIVVDS